MFILPISNYILVLFWRPLQVVWMLTHIYNMAGCLRDCKLQTGNSILLGVSLSKGQFVKVGYYLIAIIAFGLGTIFIRHMQHFFKQNYLKRAYFVLGYEFVLMVLVAMISQRAPDVITVMLLAITAAAQLQEFRKS